MKSQNIELLRPDINYSNALFTPQGDKIRYGLACIKNVGRAAIETVIQEREENGKFKDFSDFARRVSGAALNKRMIESLIKGGAFDSFGHTRRTLMANYEDIIEIETDNRNLMGGGQMFLDFMVEEAYKYKEFPESEKEKLAFEKEVAGRYITGHPLAGREEEFKEFDFNLSFLAEMNAREEDEAEEEFITQTAPQVEHGQNVSRRILSDVTIKFSAKSSKNWDSLCLKICMIPLRCCFLTILWRNTKNILWTMR